LTDWSIRPGRDSDADGFIAVIAACWAAYPGVILDVDGEMPELRGLATHYTAKGGALWTAESEGHLVGMVATVPRGAGVWEVCRVYVSPSLHGAGLGHRLIEIAEAHAGAAGATRLVLWSDTRFDRAHRFYEKRGYVRHGPIRVLQDVSKSLEFAYAKPVNGMERLDAAAAASAVPRLAEILCACVDAGASVSYLPPLPPDVARALMARLEQEASHAGRTLLTLDTRAGDAAERLYRALGWHEAGRIPGYALNADRTPCDTIFFWNDAVAPFAVARAAC